MRKTNNQFFFSDDDHAYMRVALTLSCRGLGNVYPNPSVGCVIVKNNHIIARGWTGNGGRPHAEVRAIESSVNNLEGSTVYVTLEPCAHYGKTAPCAEALIKEKVSRVVIASKDPDPRVNGLGIRILEKAGVKVETGLLQDEAEYINQGFLNKIEKNRPLITIKVASSKDGKIAKEAGKQNWITGEQSRRRGHLYRASYDAIMIGSGTAIIDDPMLDCRIEGLRKYSPVRIVLDTHLKVSLKSNLCKTAEQIPLCIMTCSQDREKIKKLEALGVKVYMVDMDSQGQIDLHKMMALLADEGITRILSEGGSKLNASLFKASLVDRLIWFRSPDIIGDKGVNALYEMSINDIGKDLNLSLVMSGTTGDDCWQEYQIIN